MQMMWWILHAMMMFVRGQRWTRSYWYGHFWLLLWRVHFFVQSLATATLCWLRCLSTLAMGKQSGNPVMYFQIVDIGDKYCLNLLLYLENVLLFIVKYEWIFGKTLSLNKMWRSMLIFRGQMIHWIGPVDLAVYSKKLETCKKKSRIVGKCSGTGVSLNSYHWIIHLGLK